MDEHEYLWSAPFLSLLCFMLSLRTSSVLERWFLARLQHLYSSDVNDDGDENSGNFQASSVIFFVFFGSFHLIFQVLRMNFATDRMICRESRACWVEPCTKENGCVRRSRLLWIGCPRNQLFPFRFVSLLQSITKMRFWIGYSLPLIHRRKRPTKLIMLSFRSTGLPVPQKCV